MMNCFFFLEKKRKVDDYPSSPANTSSSSKVRNIHKMIGSCNNNFNNSIDWTKQSVHAAQPCYSISNNDVI